MRRGKSSPYEVRCPRCDVSFAPETRTCVHCGGPTGSGAPALVQQWLEPDMEIAPSETPAPIEPNGCGPEYGTVTSDYVEATVRYRVRTP